MNNSMYANDGTYAFSKLDDALAVGEGTLRLFHRLYTEILISQGIAHGVAPDQAFSGMWEVATEYQNAQSDNQTEQAPNLRVA